MRLNPYLNFNGNCKEAFDFYQEVFNGQVVMSNSYAEAPAEMNVSEEDKAKVMHITLQIGETVLMGSDNVGAQKDFFNAGNNLSVSVNFTNVDTVERIYGKFAAAGTVVMPLSDTFWGAKFGMVTDQFGVQWMFNCTLNPEG